MLGKEFAEQYNEMVRKIEDLDCCILVLKSKSESSLYSTEEAIELIAERKGQLKDKLSYLEHLKVIE